MYGKHKDLLITMVQSEKDWVTAKDLSVYINVSVRSIKTYIDEINSIYQDLVQSSKKGYRVDREKTKELLARDGSRTPFTPNERIRFIVKKLLINTGKDLNLHRLCEDELFVGLETARKDLAAVRKRFKEFDLHVVTGGFTVTVEGDEIDKRKMLSNILLYEEFSENVFSLTVVEKVFSQYDVRYVYHTILTTCRKHHFFVNEYSLLTLLLDIVISIDRIKKDFAMPDKPARQNPDTPEYRLTRDIVHCLEEHFNITYNDLETNAITVIIISSLIKTDLDDVNMENIGQFVTADCAALIQPLKVRLASYDFIDVENGKFMSRLILHINNLLLRLEKQYTRKNPLTEHIKTSCPMIFECAVALSDVIAGQTGFTLSEHETAYIALHIGSLLSTHLSVRNRIVCVLLFPGYYDYEKKLTARLAESFGGSLVIQNVITHIEELQKIAGTVDLIISVVKIPPFFKTPFVCVNPFMTERDFDAIRRQIDNILFEKKKARLFDQLKQISGPEIFLKNKMFKNEDEAIRYISDIMIEQGYAESGFGDEVLLREHSYATAYGNIAVPHSMQMNAKKTGMFVLLTDKPIPWGKNQVNIVLLFSVNKESRSLFYDIFDNLIVLLLETPHKLKVMGCDTYEAFIQAVIECL
jgi:lichenan operon transcriptional antiterminator